MGISTPMSSSALHERAVRYMVEEERTACTLLAVFGQWTQKQALAFAQAAGLPLSPLLLERLCGFSFILTQDGVTFHMMRQVGEVLRQDCPAALAGLSQLGNRPLFRCSTESWIISRARDNGKMRGISRIKRG